MVKVYYFEVLFVKSCMNWLKSKSRRESISKNSRKLRHVPLHDDSIILIVVLFIELLEEALLLSIQFSRLFIHSVYF